MAIRFADSTKLLTSTLAIIQIMMLLYFAVTCGGTAAVLMVMITRVNVKQPASCAWWFHHGLWFVGVKYCGGILGEYLAVGTLRFRGCDLTALVETNAEFSKFGFCGLKEIQFLVPR